MLLIIDTGTFTIPNQPPFDDPERTNVTKITRTTYYTYGEQFMSEANMWHLFNLGQYHFPTDPEQYAAFLSAFFEGYYQFVEQSRFEENYDTELLQQEYQKINQLKLDRACFPKSACCLPFVILCCFEEGFELSFR